MFPVVLALTCLLTASCTRSHSQEFLTAHPVDLQQDVHIPFRFVAYGDTRFTNAANTDASNPAVRVALVQAIADAKPAFICITGDLVYNGYDIDDWKVWDRETAIWRVDKIPVFPAIGNHELHGDHKVALTNYFERFPELHDSRYYSVRAANTLLLTLDSALDETSGPQGRWLEQKLDTLPADLDFVFIFLHHPPYTSSSDSMPGGGHSARTPEQELAHMLESRQPKLRARIVVIAGHVHNYERHEHGGITYFVSGGGGAHPYLINRAPGDLFQGKGVNYHYLLVEVDRGKLTVTMNRLDITNSKESWTQPDVVTISLPAASAGKAASGK
jgi:acid phosphatase type 7